VTCPVAPFLVTNLLVDVLKASAPARIVNVTSSGERSGTINFDDLQGERGYGGIRAYNQSKLAMVQFTYELTRRLEGTGVTAKCVHPGVAATNLGRGGGGFFGFLSRLTQPFLSSPEQGAETSIYLASSPEVEGVSGKYYREEGRGQIVREVLRRGCRPSTVADKRRSHEAAFSKIKGYFPRTRERTKQFLVSPLPKRALSVMNSRAFAEP
jgi:hypothetical protein